MSGQIRFTQRIRTKMQEHLDPIEFARFRRQTSDEFERLMWQMLRNRQRCGTKFRREQPLGPYTADFFCPKARLVVEVDGSSHETEEANKHDTARDQWMRRNGIRELRLTCAQVIHELEHVIAQIDAALKQSQQDVTPHPQPLSRKWRGERV